MKILPSRPLYIQIIFTVIAFTAMVILSFYFMRNIVHNNLVRNAESVFNFAQTQLESDLQEPRMMLSGFSQTIRSMILRGSGVEDVNGYVMDIHSYFISSESPLMRSVNIFGWFEAFSGGPVFITSSEFYYEGYVAQRRPWFILAETSCGTVMEAPPYESLISGRTVVSYSRCIHNDAGDRLGIVCMEVDISTVGINIIDIALEQDGYGILLSQNLNIIGHSNPAFIGRNASDPSVPISIFYNELRSGVDVTEQAISNTAGDETVVFVRRLSNGWYLALLTPEKPFYQTLTNMAAILVLFGSIFAIALIIILIRIDAARSKSDRESRHKSAFLANMSHEIRTPMNAIIGMTTIGKTSVDTEKKDHCFAKIEDASNHLLGVISDILDMSKIEANKFELSPAEFNFEKMLQRIVNVINFRIDEKMQKFSVYIDRNIPKTLIGDDQRIAQVMTNLLGNAIKFTPEKGEIHLDTRFMEEKDGLCTIQISVSDNGIGMNYEQQKRIFNSFEQAESSTTRKYGGTGLGLAISKNIVELMGGEIWMISEVDKGSTFTFTAKLERGSSLHPGLLSDDVNIDNVRIMVVDDDKYILEYFTEIMREFKIHCDTALSGEEALKLVEQNGRYHIYFVDWKMPGMSGIQLTAELKTHQESVKSVVVMITAAEWSTIESEAKKAGVEKFLSKPLFPSAVAGVINEALGISQKKSIETNTDIKGIFDGRRVLLVEDVEINRDIVIELLSITGIKVECAENGVEAVRMFSESPDRYDLVLMDVQMPLMDGYEATRRIRALKMVQAQTVRIIAMTANVFREDIERCLEAGMDNHLSKPLDFEDVISKLRHYMPKSRD